MLTKINHIGIAVKSLEESIPFYRDQLSMPFAGFEVVAEQKDAMETHHESCSNTSGDP